MESQNDQRVIPAAFTRRRALQLFGVAATLPLLSGLSGCGANPGGDSAALTFLYLGDATQQKAFTALFKKFSDENPKITLKPTGIASGDWASFASTVSTQIAGGKSPDSMQVATEGQALFASKNLLAPLDPYISKNQKVVDEYYGAIDPNLKEWTQKFGSTDDSTYYMPGGYNTVVMYLNTDVFEKAGVEVPDTDWTWDEFTAAGVQIMDKTGAYLMAAGYGFPFVDIMPWLLTNGASTLNDDWTKATYNSPEAIEAAEFVRGLVVDGLTPKPGGEFDAAAQMKKGKLATLGGGRWPTLDMRRLEMVDNVKIVNWPTKKQKGSPIGWDAWPIFEASENKKEAWKLIEYLISKDASVYFAETGGTNVPARTEIAQSESFLADAPKGSELLSEAVSYATPIPSPPRGGEMQKHITEAWQKIILGNSDAESALNAANEKLSELL